MLCAMKQVSSLHLHLKHLMAERILKYWCRDEERCTLTAHSFHWTFIQVSAGLHKQRSLCYLWIDLARVSLCSCWPEQQQALVVIKDSVFFTVASGFWSLSFTAAGLAEHSRLSRTVHYPSLSSYTNSD